MRKRIMILMTLVLCLVTATLNFTSVNAASSFTGTMRLELTDSKGAVISDSAGAVSKKLIPGDEITVSMYGSCTDPKGFFGMQSEITYEYMNVTCTGVTTQASIWDDMSMLKNASIINTQKKIPAIGGLASTPYITSGEILVGAVTFTINSGATGALNFTITPTVQKTFMMDNTGVVANKITTITKTNITASIGGASTSTDTAITVEGNAMVLNAANDTFTTATNALVPANKTTVSFQPVVDTGNGVIDTFVVGGQTFTPTSPTETFTIPVLGAGQTTTFTINVKAQDAVTTKTYTVNITQARNNTATLSNLTFAQTGSQTTPTLYNAGNTATTSFSSSVTNYYLRIGSDTATLKVTPIITAGVGIQKATVNGNELVSGSYTFNGSMPSVISVEVTAQDGTTASYTVTVYQSSSDNSLKSVGVTDNNGVNLVYTKSGNEYIVTNNVAYTVTGFKVTASATHTNARVVITGQSGPGGFALFGSGKNAITITVTITVTSESGAVASYIVKCTRSAADTDNTLPASNGIVVKDRNGNVLAGSWNGTTFTVTNHMSYGNTGFVIVPTTTSAVATITVDGKAIQSGSTSDPITFAGSSTSRSVAVVVTSESGVQKTYTVIVNREAPSDVKTFTLKVYRSSMQPLTFKLTGSVYSVNEILAYLDKDAYFEIILDDPKATFTIDGAPVNSGVKYKVTLTEAVPQSKTIISLLITAEDGTTSSFTIEITRAGADVDTTLSDMDVIGVLDNVTYANSGITGNTYSYDLPLKSGHQFRLDLVANALTSKIYVSTSVGSLGSLYTSGVIYNVGDIVYITVEAQSATRRVYVIKTQKVDERDTDNSLDIIKVIGYESAFTFHQSTYTYSLSVPFSVKQITLEIKATSAKATLEITPGQGIQNLAVGVNTFTVRVKAENGSYSGFYTLTVNRANGNPDNFLESLRVNGTNVLGFNKYTNDYTVVVGRNTSNATIDYTFSPTATASTKPSNSQVLQTGKATFFYITVTSETGIINEYTVVVYAADTDKTLTNIELLEYEFGSSLLNSNGDLAYTFAAGNSNLVTITVPYTTTSLFIQITKGRWSTASLSGLKNLVVGDNGIFIIYVTSEYGIANTNLDDPTSEQSATYRIKIIREAADSENRLQTLSALINGVEQIAGFTPDTITIKIENVAPTATMLFLSGTTMSKKAKILSGMGGIDITGLGSASSGTILTSIIVEAEDKTKKEYKIIISREVIVLDDNNAISSITVVDSNGKTHVINFVDSTTSYTINIPGSTASATITVKTPAGAKSTVTGAGVHMLNTGANSVTVYATSESGKQGTVYTINFIKAAVSNDATLSDITIDGTTITGFLPTKTNYTINVGNATASIDIDALVNNAMASISGGTGNVNLNIGTNSYSITVRAEDGTTKVYIINVVRDAKTTLDDLYVENHTISPTFNSGTLNYTLSVPYAVKTAVIEAIASNPNFVTITGIGNVNLAEGVNTFNVVIKANSGASTTYVITITRTAGNPDNYLTDLEVDGSPVVGFSQTVTTYTIILPRDKSFTSFTYHCSPTATVTSITDTSLSFGKNTKEITVTSETGVTRKYTLYIYCADQEFAIDDIVLTAQNGNTLTNAVGDEAFIFSQTTLEYTFNVPYSTTAFNIETTPHSDYAKLFLTNGLKNLKVGLNEFIVYVKSEYGVANPSAPNTTSQKYIIKITRNSASTDSSLKSLSVIISGVERIATFDPTTKTYVIENIGDSATTAIITGVANDLSAIIIGNGTKKLDQGSVTDGFVFNYTVKVTAEDGSHTEYSITISRYKVNLSEDNSLAGLLLFDSANKYYIDDASFDPAVLKYTITIPYGPMSYTITPEKLPISPATLSGGGNFTIKVSDYGTTKTHMVFATSENGVKGTVYEITVIIESPSINSTLTEIKVDGILLPGFLPTKFDGYVLNRSFGSVSADIKATLADKLAGLRGVGTFQLVEGPNTFAVVVTAQDGSISTYTILINRAYADPYLDNLMVSGEQLLDNTLKAVTFNPFTLEYRVVVSYMKIKCEIIAAAPGILAAGGQIKGDGSKDLQVGENEFTITVISANSTITEYTIIVTRRGETSTNTNVLSAKIDEITQFAEDFKNSKDKNFFEYEVSNDITKLTVSVIVENQGDANNESATYHVYGSNFLKVGVNDVIILITASDKETTRAIVVRVTRLPMTFEVVEDKYDALKVEKTEEENVYNMKIGKNNLSSFDFKQYIKTTNNLMVDVMTDLTKNCSEVLVRITDGDEIKIVRFVITDRVESINYVFYIIAGVCAMILAGILVAVNKDKYGKVTKNRKPKTKTK